MAIDKSTRQHYAIQGGGPNYLGKQKMVKAPKKWLSSPDHEPAELAYITKKEKDILLDLNIYGSLKNGKPNRGPSGIMSLQGDMGGWGGGGGNGGNGGGGGGGERRYEAPAPKAAPKKAAPKAAPLRDPDPATEFVPGDVISKPKTYTSPINIHGGPTVKEELKSPSDEAYEMVGGVKVPLGMRGVKGVDPREDPERYFETISPIDKVMSKDEKDFTIEDKRIIEDWESAQDWDKVKDLSKKGYSSKEINDAMEKGLLTKTDPRSMQSNLFQRSISNLRNIIPKTGLERSLLGGLKKSFASTDGGMFDPKRMAFNLAKNYGMKKLGLGALNPWLGLASLFGFDPFRSLTNKFAKKPAFDVDAASKLGLRANRFPTQKTDTLTAKRARDAYEPNLKENVIAKNIAKFTGKSDISPEFQHLVKQAKAMPKQAKAKTYDPNDMGTWYDTHPATGEAVMTPGFKEKYQSFGRDKLNPRTVYDSYEFKDTGNPFKEEVWQRPRSYDSTRQARTYSPGQTRMSGRTSTQKPGLSLADKIGYTQHMDEDIKLKTANIDNQFMNRMGGLNVTQANPGLGLKNPLGPGIGLTALAGAAGLYQGTQSILGDQSIGEAIKDTYENIMGQKILSNPKQLAQYNQILGRTGAASGGRIDRPLMGRSRYI